MGLLLLALACSTPPATSWTDCAPRSGSARDDCYTQTLPREFCTDAQGAARLVEEHVSDPVVRDFIYLEVTNKVAPQTPMWCERIQDAALKERCMTVVRRPHLHRDMTGLICPRTAGPP
jgi:hypothetical protein